MVNARRLRPYCDPVTREADTIPGTPNEQLGDTGVDKEALVSQPEPSSDSSDTGSEDEPNNVTDPGPEQLLEDEARASELEELYEVENITATKVVKGKQEYRIKWKNYKDQTWEPEENIPRELLQSYHNTHTKTGKRRKRGKASSSFHRKS